MFKFVFSIVPAEGFDRTSADTKRTNYRSPIETLDQHNKGEVAAGGVGGVSRRVLFRG